MNILIANKHVIFRSGIRSLLQKTTLEKRIFEIETSDLLEEFIRKKDVGLLFIDSELHGFNPLNHVSRIKKMFPSVYVVVSCFTQNEPIIHAAFEAGTNSIISREISNQDFLSLMNFVTQNRSYYCKDIAEVLFRFQFAKERHQKSVRALDQISKRECEVLRLICEQMDNNKIADKLFISTLTVRRHRQNLMAKTKASNTAGLVVFAIRNGIYKVFESNYV